MQNMWPIEQRNLLNFFEFTHETIIHSGPELIAMWTLQCALQSLCILMHNTNKLSSGGISYWLALQRHANQHVIPPFAPMLPVFIFNQ